MNTLEIISVSLSAFVVILLLLQFVIRPKSSLSSADIIRTMEKENEKLKAELSANLKTQTDVNKQLNAMILETIRSYNESIYKNLKLSKQIENENAEKIERSLEQISKTNSELSEKVELKLEKINTENIKQLDEMRQVVDEKLNVNLTNRLNESFSLISERLEALYKGFGEIQNLSNGVNDLNKILGNVKVRGTFGEVQLNSLLEQMLSNGQYISNVQIKENSAERVEFAVVLPGKDEKNILLPIDAKFPLEDYSRLVDATDKKEIESCRKALEQRIKGEAKSIRQKYIYPPKTTDFAIMYIPLEGLYAEVLKIPGLVDFVQREYRVIICCPTTLAALLSSLQMGFKTLYIEKRSSEIWELLSTFRREFGVFLELLSKTQKKILEANDTIESATKKTQKIQKQLLNVTSASGFIESGDDEDENDD